MTTSERRLTVTVLGALALLLFVVSFTGCATLAEQIEKPTVRLTEIVFLGGDLREQTYGVTLQVDNPNGIALPIRTVSYNLNLAGKDFASGATADGFRIPANGSDLVQLQIRTNLLDSLNHLGKLLSGGSTEIDYRMSGDIQVDLPLVSAIPFSQSGTIPLVTRRADTDAI